jgi:branched-chain amino acid transport system permease protein
MVSLAQVALFGIAGFTLGNVVTAGETKGLNLGWDPWLGVVLAIAVATGVGLILGAVASRATGIYFLMLTLVFSVIANKFFGQVTLLSGFGGIGSIQNHTPGLIGRPSAHPDRLYYVALLVAVCAYLLIRYVLRTPFGMTLQGVRDDPVRMGALGYNVPLHRTLAFTFAAFIASLGGVLFVWWNSQISPSTIGFNGYLLDLLVMAVIGGLYRIEGAWVGAFVFILLDNYIRDIGFIHSLGLSEERFHTVIGVVFLAIVLLSPGGLLGLGDRVWREVLRLRGRRRLAQQAAVEKPRPGVP